MDLFDLTGKVAVVTGGTRGIGLMMARGLLQAGAATVYVSSRKADAGDAAVAELSAFGRAVSVPADLSQEAECLRLAAEVGLAEERIHILVNNAGAAWGAELAEFPASGWDVAAGPGPGVAAGLGRVWPRARVRCCSLAGDGLRLGQALATSPTLLCRWSRLPLPPLAFQDPFIVDI